MITLIDENYWFKVEWKERVPPNIHGFIIFPNKKLVKVYPFKVILKMLDAGCRVALQ